MAGLAFHLRPGRRGSTGAQAWDGIRQRLWRSDRTEVEELLFDGRVCEVVHHGLLSGVRIAVDGDQSVLLLCGAPALASQPDVLLGAEEVLRVLRAGRLPLQNAFVGQYAFVFHDIKSGEVLAESDLFGVYPLYYRVSADGLSVCSQISAAASEGVRSLDLAAAGELLRLGVVVTERTLISGVRRLLPGQRLSWSNGNHKVERLTWIRCARDQDAREDLLPRLEERFRASLRRYPLRDRGAFCTLSGGLDSRLALLALQEEQPTPVAWSCGERTSTDLRMAEEFALSTGSTFLKHEVVGTDFPIWLERSILATECRVPFEHMHFLDAMFKGDYPPGFCVHGLIGDVIMGGDYEDSRIIRAVETGGPEGLRGLMSSLIYWPHQLQESLLGVDLRQSWHGAESAALLDLAAHAESGDAYEQAVRFRFAFRGCGFIVPALMSQVIPWSDPILPYLDATIVELCAALRRNVIADRKLQVSFAQQFFPRTFNLPRVKDGVVVDWSDPGQGYEQAIARQRRALKIQYYLNRLTLGRLGRMVQLGYPDYNQWLRQSPAARTFARDRVLDSSIARSGLINPKEWEKLVRWQRQGRDICAALGAVLQLAIFVDEMIDM